ncbi:MAG: ATP-binding protein [Thermodesulfobacteriota bacterium]
MAVKRVGPDEAYHRCDPAALPFADTTEVEQDGLFIGQERALEAVDFGIGMERQGFNLFVLGPEGSGRHTVISAFIDAKAKEQPTPNDWCYVYNFQEPHKPLAIELAPGQGSIFKQEMFELVDTLQTTIPAIFEGDDYRARINSVNEALSQKIDNLYHEMEEMAKKQSIAVSRSDQGFRFAPMRGDGETLSIEEFRKLPAEVKKKIEKTIEELHGSLQEMMHQISIWKRESEELRRKLKKDTAKMAVSDLIETLKGKYKGNDKLVSYLAEVEEDITERVDDFIGDDGEGQNQVILALGGSQAPSFEQYEVNVLVSNTDIKGAPVVYEDLPTYQNLHGRIEHQAKMGVLTTKFTLIKQGALHRANSGYLIVDARRLLMQPFAYDSLKRTLRSQQIRIEPVERLMGLMSTKSLEPEPIELATKVVLIGEPMIYYLLNAYDPEFAALFKVQADFEHDMTRSAASQAHYARLIARLATDSEMLALDNGGVARVIEEASREAGDREKLSLRIRNITNLMQEADYLARKAEKERIDCEDVAAAIAAARRRGGRIRDQMFAAMAQGVRHIETTGSLVGQVNGLSVLVLGRDSFGCPTRITALTRPGRGKIVDIEREVELGGPIHSKGVMILSAFLAARYARTIPLSLQASLVFEQSYGGVEGDSASCAELCVLISALARVAIRQEIAITGSVSQQGEVQAIGGVNEKIEGFFDLCDQRGLTGEQGVVIPASNIRHLMLRADVVAAITEGRFAVTAVERVDEALELLTGQEAGERLADGTFPAESINGRVEATLQEYASRLQEFEKGNGGDDAEKDKGGQGA